MTAWEAFVANQRRLNQPRAHSSRLEASPKLVNIDLQPYQTVQACERADIMKSVASVTRVQRDQCVPCRQQPAIRR